jgi:hypothetical protein
MRWWFYLIELSVASRRPWARSCAIPFVVHPTKPTPVSESEWLLPKSRCSKSDDASRCAAAASKVSELFAGKGTHIAEKRGTIVGQICTELGVHAQIEEEIFYPAVKQALKDKEMVPEASVEHASLKSLIAQVEGVQPDGEMFDAKIKVMSEYVKHHVKEEQNESKRPVCTVLPG